jgi:ferredoxin-like protein FixX
MVKKSVEKTDSSIIYGPPICGEKLRKLLEGKYEVVPRKIEHVKVDSNKCNGCELCYILCPTGVFEMENGKAKVKYLDLCAECGACFYICQVHAIDFSYPEGGAGIILKYS